MLADSIDNRRAVIEQLLDDVDSDMPAAELVRRLLHDIATDSARAIKPLVDLAARECPALRGRSLTLDQIRRSVLGEVTLMLAGNPSIIFDGDADGVVTGPQDVRRIGEIVSESIKWASALCPDVDVDLSSIRQLRGRVLLGRFASPEFLDEFFEDPNVMEIFDPQTVSILLAAGRGFFEVLMHDRWEWFFTAVLPRRDLREMIAFDHPHMVLTALAASPDLAHLVDEHFRNELQLGLSRMTASERAGIRSLYAKELESIGLRI